MISYFQVGFEVTQAYTPTVKGIYTRDGESSVNPNSWWPHFTISPGQQQNPDVFWPLQNLNNH